LARRLKKTLYVVLFAYYKQLVNVGPLKKIQKGSRQGGEEARPELWGRAAGKNQLERPGECSESWEEEELVAPSQRGEESRGQAGAQPQSVKKENRKKDQKKGEESQAQAQCLEAESQVQAPSHEAECRDQSQRRKGGAQAQRSRRRRENSRKSMRPVFEKLADKTGQQKRQDA
jgi:hypothetical protein